MSSIRKSFSDLYGNSAEERAALQAEMAKLNEEAALVWDDPVRGDAWRHERAAEMTQVIQEGFEHENVLQLMTEVQRAGFNDRISIREVRGLRVHWLARGGTIEQSTLNAKTMELPRETVGFRVSEFEDKLKVNFAETQATLVSLGAQRLDAAINQRALALIQAALPSGGDYHVPVSGLSLSALNTAVREVRDEAKTNELVIVGRSTMTDQIGDLLQGSGGVGAYFIPETNEQLIRQGQIGVYRGVPIVTLLNHKDDANVSFFPGNELYVIARDASKFVFWGDILSRDYIEQGGWYWHYMLRMDVGGIVHRPERIRRIVDSTVTA